MQGGGVAALAQPLLTECKAQSTRVFPVDVTIVPASGCGPAGTQHRVSQEDNHLEQVPLV